MDAVRRMQLLFSQDPELLQVNTHLRVLSMTELPVADAAQEPQRSGLSERSERSEPDQVEKPLSKKQPGFSSLPNPGPVNSLPSPHDGAFCPLLAISKFPYRHVRGDLMQQVASRFFDKGQFWERTWDLYYIHVPPRLGPHHLLLVPAAQVRALLREINTILECSLSLPSGEDPGLLLRFDRHGFPQPSFLGRSTTRAMKDQLEENIPISSFKPSPEAMDEHFIAFEQMIEAACVAGRGKNKSKARKRRLRIQRELELGECVNRARAYLGLRAYAPLEELTDCEWDEQPDATSLCLAEDKPVPHPFWTGPVFVSIDVEANEACHSQVTEVGISSLDTLDLLGVAPGRQGKEWQSCIKSQHFRVKEYAHIVNKKYVTGCPDKFLFGESEWVQASELEDIVTTCLTRLSFCDDPEKDHLRPIVLVGHSLAADIQFLQLHHIDVSSKNANIVDFIDTAELFRAMHGEAQPRSLGGVLDQLGMIGWHLHNAGNDACYTLQTMVAVLVKDALAN
ncbi:hypothetical protein P175DRAFT_0515516 [Aspergillus ochraceoroseus IBT 24754]|uniref:Gfd2/YDR514C-like C-terminal domain-containing protein n=3 Tax=Aspergillus subgen. Nidulantes TaxID=2720870 RepID=A0A0F8V9C6_9EURO|nr:uncharacterized protein P175DRAFT_0515516 [Aspergillus ochraceoroseus IBT 24754]KKK14207.1 hypothetical protein AOCH_006351 [Aspergillus ochraceoroseus]KKK19616.1 hypothetical protein ARAM_005185 [Aspergillus rambellii]PTU21357.1 hypothetical protein P175DRAFT_0515516 [Aspergillus ochraceoroseus IBT 24754]